MVGQQRLTLIAGALTLCICVAAAKHSVDLLLAKPAFAYLDVFGSSHNGTSTPDYSTFAYAKAESDRAAEKVVELREENDWKNDLILFWCPAGFRNQLPRIVHSWLRNWIACMALYFTVSGAWAYYAYWCFGRFLYKPGHIPPQEAVAEQAWVAFIAMPGYAVLPAVTEWVVEGGHTLVYTRIADVGVLHFLAFFAAYMACVEFLVYWTHRWLHENRASYKALHHVHHKYNKEHTLSPFAGLAFHPVDGILQALPYAMLLFFIPMHFLTFELLLFMTGIWTTNIHDCLHGKVMPIMGAGYHSIHHTTYAHNYGHYFVYCDYLFGTLEWPEEFSAQHETKQL